MTIKNFRRLAAVLTCLLCTIGNNAHAETCPNGTAPGAIAPAVTIKAVGDIVFGSDWPTSSYPSAFETRVVTQLQRVLGSADVIFGNFEGTFTRHDVSTKNPNASTVFAFRMPPRFASLLQHAGFNAINIANNHTFDFGSTGFNDTLTNLSRAGITVVGEANKIAFQKIGDVNIAWIGVSHLYRHNNVNDRQRFEALMQQARPTADLVIVSMQAGAEGSEALRVKNEEEMFLGENRGNTFAFARRAIDLGADLVLGHGPHVVRGLECYKGKLIAYSLGNFVGYGALSIKRAAAISMILEVKLSKDGQTLGFNVIPIKFNPQKLPEPDDTRLVHYLLNDLSRLAPLNGSVQLPVNDAGTARYRQWLAASELTKILGQ